MEIIYPERNIRLEDVQPGKTYIIQNGFDTIAQCISPSYKPSIYFCLMFNGCKYVTDLDSGTTYKVAEYNRNVCFKEINSKLVIKE